mgnify:CR=1 FL=1
MKGSTPSNYLSKIATGIDLKARVIATALVSLRLDQ